MERHFEEKEHAKIYHRYRPRTLQAVADVIMKYVREKNFEPLTSMIDVGCGSGQNTLVFSPFFEKILGTDISANMIAEASADSARPVNVSFVVSPAETLPVSDESVDLVTGAQCFHWFDHVKFHQEMNRVLKPNGVLAVLGHDPEFLIDPQSEDNSKKLTDVVNVFNEAVGVYLKDAAASLFDHYNNISFPYIDVVRESVRCDVPITLADYVGVLETYSCYQALAKNNPEAAAEAKNRVIKTLMSILNVAEGTAPEDVQTTMRLENFIVMGRKNV